MKKIAFIALSLLVAVAAKAETIVDVTQVGAEKILVSVNVAGSDAFKKSLMRNLTLSGAFKLVNSGASIVVSGQVGGNVVVEGRGKKLTLPTSASDAKIARQDARKFSDKICETYAKQKGFASTRIAFVNKKGRSEELCIGYPDGADVRQITSDGTACVGPRWKSSDVIYYTGYVNGAPQIFEIDANSCVRKLKWGFGGLTAGATVSPDGSTAAIILSKPFGNPELCTINIGAGTWKRMTTTRLANEGQPAWSPDGRSIVYVSDETRRLHLYVIDPATKKSRRITSSGTQNIDPDWGPDGRITYITKRSGKTYVAVLDPAEGDKAARLVTEAGNWEHPSWARDMRHIIAERDGVLYSIDTMENGDAPVKLFSIPGKMITPSLSR